MIRVLWNDVVLAEAPRTIRVEGHHYFRPESLRWEYFVESSTKTICPWKGMARYYSIVVQGETKVDAAWCYPRPSLLARRIKNHVAFGDGVRLEGQCEVEDFGL
jgi:uncharacterized protein (DUF427 family)